MSQEQTGGAGLGDQGRGQEGTEAATVFAWVGVCSATPLWNVVPGGMRGCPQECKMDRDHS